MKSRNKGVTRPTWVGNQAQLAALVEEIQGECPVFTESCEATAREHVRLAQIYQDPRAEVSFRQILISGYRRSHRFVDALEQALICSEICEKHGLVREQVEVKLDHAGVLLEAGDPKSAITILKKSRAMAKEGSYDDLLARGLMLTGLCHSRMGRQVECLKYYITVVEFYEEYISPQLLLVTLGNLISSFNELGRYSEALPYLRKAVEIQGNHNLGNVEAVLQANSLVSRSQTLTVEETLCELASVEETITASQSQSYVLPSLLQELSLSFQRRGELNVAAELLERAKSLPGAAEHGHLDRVIKRHLAEVYQELGEFEKAISELDRAFAELEAANASDVDLAVTARMIRLEAEYAHREAEIRRIARLEAGIASAEERAFVARLGRDVQSPLDEISAFAAEIDCEGVPSPYRLLAKQIQSAAERLEKILESTVF